MNVIDSSAWLEYFANGPNAGFFARAIEDTPKLIVPSLTIYEVFKRTLQQRSEGDALQVIAVMMQGRVIDLDTPIALNAAKLSLELKLRLADSVILATARASNATLWTQDTDFQRLPGVQYRAGRR